MKLSEWLHRHSAPQPDCVPTADVIVWLLNRCTPSKKRDEVLDEVVAAGKDGVMYIPRGVYDDEYYDDVCYDPDLCGYCGTKCC
jgi:hypothetical protein